MSNPERDDPLASMRPGVARLLAALSDPPGREVTTEELIRVVVLGPASHPPTALRTYVARLRRLLPNGALRTTARGYVLDPWAVPPTVPTLAVVAGPPDDPDAPDDAGDPDEPDDPGPEDPDDLAPDRHGAQP